MNRLTVVGRIVRDVELREIGEGRLVINNTLAIARNYKTDQGQETDFINFVAWGKRAELIEEYCDKGDLIGFDGRVQSRTYQNEEDQTVYVVEMLVDSVHFLQPRRQRTNKRVSKQKESENTGSGTQQKEEDKVIVSKVEESNESQKQSLQEKIEELVN